MVTGLIEAPVTIHKHHDRARHRNCLWRQFLMYSIERLRGKAAAAKPDGQLRRNYATALTENIASLRYVREPSITEGGPLFA